jgi:uncharacterized protein YifN (PemK superfamily)
MALSGFFPNTGHVLLCDFSYGFIAPEMLKKRPVIVISRKETHNRKLCTVVPLSTTAPAPPQSWHYPLINDPCPIFSNGAQVWVKCDMIYTVSFQRLDKFHRKTRSGGREYYAPKIEHDELVSILDAVKTYMF